ARPAGQTAGICLNRSIDCMQQRSSGWLIPILILFLAAAYIVWPNTGVHFTLGSLAVNEDFTIHEGLDLRGGLQVLLEAKVPADTTVDSRALSAARAIVEQRVNGLGVSEPLVQAQGSRRIVVELPGVTNSQQAIDTIQQTGLLEFVPLGSQTL